MKGRNFARVLKFQSGRKYRGKILSGLLEYFFNLNRGGNIILKCSNTGLITPFSPLGQSFKITIYRTSSNERVVFTKKNKITLYQFTSNQKKTQNYFFTLFDLNEFLIFKSVNYCFIKNIFTIAYKCIFLYYSLYTCMCVQKMPIVL